MANENHASFARIGFAILIGALTITLTLVYLGGLRGRRDEFYVETYYDREVSGLSVGSAVNFRGVKIGEVREIDFVGNHYDAENEDNARIYILMAINSKKLGYYRNQGMGFNETVNFLVRERGLRASVTASGVTGLSRIECDLYPDLTNQNHHISWHPVHPFVPQKVSLLANFSDAATRVMNQINRMDFLQAWSNVNATVDSMSKTMKSAQTMLETRQSDMEKLSEDVTETASTLRELVHELKTNPSLLIRDRRPVPVDETAD